MRFAVCDARGNFCLLFLPPDEYALLAHGDHGGRVRIPATAVQNNSLDAGSHKLAAGGAIIAELPPQWISDTTVAVSAVDSLGVPIASRPVRPAASARLPFAGLWPGTWRVAVRRGEKSLAEATVAIRGAETAICRLGGA
jgi:hypothetical protein